MDKTPPQYTRREREVLARLTLGLSSKQIASELEITAGSVDRRISRLLLKAKAPNRLTLVLWAEREHVALRLAEILVRVA